jgi:HlyD family secretion protein
MFPLVGPGQRFDAPRALAKTTNRLSELERRILIELLTMKFSLLLLCGRRKAFRDRSSFTAWVCLSILLAAGCDSKTEIDSSVYQPPLTALSALGTEAGNAILAQGQLAPARGILTIVAPPGDRVLQLDVAEGDWIQFGQRLGRLESHRAKQIELDVAETQLKEARMKLDADESVAKARLQVAQVELQKAELKVQESIDQFQRAEASGGTLDLARQRVKLAANKLTQLRQTADNMNTSRLVSTGTIEQQDLEVQQAKSDLQSARLDAESAIAAGKLSVEAAKGEIRAAELAIKSATASSPLESISKRIELLRLQVAAAELTSPFDGEVLAIDIGPGEATTGMPIMRVANTHDMVCRVEMNVAELPRVKMGARATITSPAFRGVMSGEVQSISSMM